MRLFNAQHPNGLDMGPSRAASHTNAPQYGVSAAGRGEARKLGDVVPPQLITRAYLTRAEQKRLTKRLLWSPLQMNGW